MSRSTQYKRRCKVKDKIYALKEAFPHTIPVLTGFIFLGIAYGILMNSKGYGLLWTFLMSLFAFAGSAQYVAITTLTAVFNPLYSLFLTLMVNARHLFYGISMLDKYKDTGQIKPYLIFGLCDETFSIIHGTRVPDGISKKWFLFFITLLDHGYWVIGSVIGSLLGSVIPWNTEGLDFVLTALFVAIFLNQWKERENRKPAMVGIISSAICLFLFGPNQFLIPTMCSIVIALSIMRKIHRKESAS